MQTDQERLQEDTNEVAQNAADYLQYDAQGNDISDSEDCRAGNVMEVRYLCELYDGDKATVVGVQLHVTAGGPDIWIDTHREKAVGTGWFGIKAEADIDSNVAEALLDEYRETAYFHTMQ